MRWLPLLLLSACFNGDKPDDSTVAVPDDTEAPLDADRDGYSEDDDCDDGDASVHPGAEELCNGVDDDCDEQVDEDASDLGTWYADVDGDGWGWADSSVQACEQPTAHVADDSDCDDSDPLVYPTAEELCDGVSDNDCDGSVDEGCGPAPDYPFEGADVMLLGANEGDWAGYDVAGAGDLNGDGYDDLLIGAPGADYPGIWPGDSYGGWPTGAAMVVLGPVGADLDLTSADAWLQGTQIEGNDTCDNFGTSVAGVGDTNGDGLDDVLIGDPWYYDNDYYDDDPSGLAALFYGPVTGVRHAFEADAVLLGDSWYGKAGYDVAGAGDVNGDGFTDLLISAVYGTTVSENGGEVYLFHGPLTGTYSTDDSHATIANTGDDFINFGNAINSAGDVNGDGLDDVLVGAEYDSSAWENGGSASLFLAPLSGEVLLSDAHLVFEAEAEYENVGSALDGVGDLDGDGYGDFVVGVQNQSFGSLYVGAIWVIYGDAAGGPSGQQNMDVAGAVLHGSWQYERVGMSLDGSADLDADGHTDFLVGGQSYDGVGDSIGEAWLVHGPVYGTAAIDDVASWHFLGTSAGDQAGSSVSFAGDVDADGIDDILIGAPREATNGTGAGAAYLIFGSGL